MENNTTRTLSILIEKDPGILLRIISLITRRRFNLETLTLGDCEDKHYQRLILNIKNERHGSDESALQLIKQLQKLINIIDIQDISYVPVIQRELILVKLSTNLKERDEILKFTSVYQFTVLETTSTTISLEIIGDQKKISNIETFLKKYEVLELVRTGKLALIEHTTFEINLAKNRFQPNYELEKLDFY
uniref:acetolactate synthase small subunit n=1 Tax=Dictyotopsis propagulifera TaxID=670095 RepID=UPI002E7A6D87|nr:acetolactate synthase small subunit [Dictyotopsis propagulifera]WAM63193.1 acetolactate synthase small subunit [Dictyotopsis propagulifera]